MILEFKLGKRELGEAARKGALEWFRTERGTQILAGIWILIVFASHDWTVTGGGYGTDQAGLAGAVFLVNTALALLVKVMYGLVLIWLALVWLESLGAQGLGQVEQRLTIASGLLTLRCGHMIYWYAAREIRRVRQGRHIWVICVWDESTQKEQRLIVPKGIFPTKEGRAQFTRFLAEQRRCPEGQEMRQPEDFCSAEDAGEPILAVSVVWNPERRKQLAAETARVYQTVLEFVRSDAWKPITGEGVWVKGRIPQPPKPNLELGQWSILWFAIVSMAAVLISGSWLSKAPALVVAAGILMWKRENRKKEPDFIRKKVEKEAKLPVVRSEQYLVTEQGIWTRSPGLEQHLPWEMMRGLIESEQLLSIMARGAGASLVLRLPKQALSAEQRSRFAALCGAKGLDLLVWDQEGNLSYQIGKGPESKPAPTPRSPGSPDNQNQSVQ
ncbi:MAG TPA: YcxB family protein [Candidatus Ventrimonas merdavium]|nr:YcxB family protein [Candidatus Ventrimonas merdavium]